MNIFITKFVSQRCLGYDPKTDRSQWHMIAEFTDGKVREALLWLKTDEECTGYEAGWKLYPTNTTAQHHLNSLDFSG